jgi:hypothetical protein
MTRNWNMLVAITLMTLAFTVLTPTYGGIYSQFTSVLAQDEGDKSGDLTEAEGGEPFGGSNVGTYDIGQDRSGLRIQVNMNDPPSADKVYVVWLVDNSTGDDLSVGQLVDNTIAITQPITNQSLYNLIEVTEENAGNVGVSRNTSAVVGGANLE